MGGLVEGRMKTSPSFDRIEKVSDLLSSYNRVS